MNIAFNKIKHLIRVGQHINTHHSSFVSHQSFVYQSSQHFKCHNFDLTTKQQESRRLHNILEDIFYNGRPHGYDLLDDVNDVRDYIVKQAWTIDQELSQFYIRYYPQRCNPYLNPRYK